MDDLVEWGAGSEQVRLHLCDISCGEFYLLMPFRTKYAWASLGGALCAFFDMLANANAIRVLERPT